MQTQTQTQSNGKGKGFPKTADNPTGYTLDERARRDKPKERESKRGAVKGRTDSDGQDAVIKIESLQTKVDQLVKLHNDAADAGSPRQARHPLGPRLDACCFHWYRNFPDSTDCTAYEREPGTDDDC